jgi:hypothetical protein
LVSLPQILRALSDDKSSLIFDLAIHGGLKKEIIIKRLKITRKQYYSRLSALTDSGLIERKNGEYIFTSLGGVVHEALQLIKSGVSYYWSLKAVDSFKLGFSEQERGKIIEQLIDKQELRDLLIKKLKEDQPKN